MIYSLAVENIHCSSCEEDLTEVLHEQDPKSETQFLQDREIVRIKTPNADFDVEAAARKLRDCGFDVRRSSAVGTPPSPMLAGSMSKRNNWMRFFNQEGENRDEQHKEICNGCGSRRESVQGGDPPAKTSTSSQSGQQAESGSQPKNQAMSSCCSKKSSPDQDPTSSTSKITAKDEAVRAVFAVSGMTCASCANSITAALRAAVPDAIDVSADSLQGAAFVLLQSRNDVERARVAIEDAGFETQLEEVLPLAAADVTEYKLVASIQGMTCASCSSSVAQGLDELPFVVKCNVDALEGRAEIYTYECDPSYSKKITQTVAELGYECRIVGGFSEVHSSQARSRARTVTLSVRGIFCERCPNRIMDALRTYGDAVDIVDPISMSEPYVKFTYLPSPPRLTIRSIMVRLKEANPNLQFEIVRPKSLEQMAAENQQKEKKAVAWRLVLTTVLAVPATIAMFFPTLMMNNWFMFALATPVYFFSADIFHRKAIKEIRVVIKSKRPIKRRLLHFGSMNLLMSLGTSISYWVSVLIMFLHAGETYFDSVVFLTFFLLVGRYLDIFSKIKTTNAVSLVSKVRPDEVQLVASSQTTEKVNVDLVEVGDYIRVFPGQRCAIDGTITSGESEFNESMLTGEALPVPKISGVEVYAGTLNSGRHAVTVLVTAVGSGTLLDDIVEAVRHGQMQRAPIERYVEQFTSLFVPLVVYLAITVWIVWYIISGSAVWSMQFAVATFVVACPCGIGLAAPTALYIGSGLSAKYGVLARGGGEAFQEAAQLEVMCFDKTGTITMGTGFRITDTWGADNDEIVQLACRLERDSVHPLADAVIEYAKGRLTTDARCSSDIESISDRGRGVRAEVTGGEFKGHFAVMGNESLIRSTPDCEPSRVQLMVVSKWRSEGKSIMILAIEGQGIKLMLAAADQIRPESRSVVHELKQMGIQCWMISGDNPQTAKAVAATVRIDHERVIAGVLPHQKSEKVQELQRTAGAYLGRSYGRAIVGMVGDGVNDAPALAASDVGVALGRGADIALSSSQFVLLREDLRGLPVMIKISKAVISKVKANFFWAAVYNFVAIPIAAGVFYPWTHRRLDPVWASLAMALSSVSVMVNSLLLRRFKPE